MILYFADRQLNILGQASTKLPQGLTVINDKMIEDVETGVSSFECEIPYDRENRADVENFCEVGNYLLRSFDDANEFYTIIEAEVDTYKQTVWIYAEDAGMDLLNEVFGEYEADKAYPITHYVNKFAAGSGFTIGTNEAKSLTRKLSWDGESTAAERIASVATQFDGCEISYTFEVRNLTVTKKFINIFKNRGKDIGVQLYLNRDIDSIVTSKSIANLATALQCTGGTPEDSEDPITLKGYKHDDGDFYVDSSGVLKSRTALKRWARYLWKDDDATESGGHITKQYSYDTTSQKTLCSRAITELKKIRDMEVNYEIDLKRLPDNVKVGDRVNVIDDAGGLYLSTRILQLERSVCDETQKAILGEYLIKSDGISQKVADLAAQFAKQSQSAARALAMAQTAKAAATDAKERVDAAIESVEEAQKAVEDVADVVETARQSAAAAQEAANNAQSIVDNVESRIEDLEGSLSNAESAAQQAQQAAQTAETKATEAQQAAVNAEAEAAEAKDAADAAQSKADQAELTASSAKGIAEQAIDDAETASTTAAAAKLDAEAARADIGSLSDRLTTVSSTMQAEYARKTDLTETEADLQSQISRNAALLQSTITLQTVLDETANDADSYAEQAQVKAQEAQAQATQAAADATAAQAAADQAAIAANAAQAEADTARAAATTAQNVADQAAADLTAAKEDLATIESRVDATEAEIEAARQAVANAQAAADTAQANADRAVNEAAAAQKTADNAATAANNARAEADNAARYAKYAQAVANEAKAAQEAQETADDAAAIASEAQRTAAQAVTDAETAQAQADAATAAAAAAQQAANDADAKAAQAASDLAAAEQNLADVTSRVGATEEEVAAAQQAVNTAQAAADKAKQDAAAAQSTADTAKANAATAQTAANNAKAAADQAQADANAAQQAADKAQADVDKLTVRVSSAETKITQNTEQIALRATRTEVAQTLGGYYTIEQTNAAIVEKANEINLSVDGKIEGVQVGGRNLLKNSRHIALISNDASLYPVSHTTETENSREFRRYRRTDTSSRPYTMSLYSSIPVTEITDCLTNQEMTFSFLIRCSHSTTTSTMNRIVIDDVNNSFATEKTYNIGADWQRISVTATITAEYEMVETNLLRFNPLYMTIPEGAIDTFYIDVCEWKIEKGNKATDWTPAPEDIDDKFSDYSTTEEMHRAIKLSEDGIFLTVKDTYTSKEDFNNLDVGGRNLVRDSSLKEKTDMWSFSSDNTYSFENGFCEVYRESTNGSRTFNSQSTNSNALLKPDNLAGGTFTLSAEIKLLDGYTVTDGSTLFYRCNTTELSSGFQEISVRLGGATTEWKKVNSTFTFGEYNFDGSCQVCFALENAEKRGICIRNIKLEKGNKATDWTPAPEDLESGIDKAQESADMAQSTADGVETRVTSAESIIQQLADNIAMLVTDENGTSLMTQEGNNWTFSTADIQSSVNDLSKLLEEMTVQYGDTKAVVSVLQQAVSDIGIKTDYINIGTHTYTNSAGATVTEPCIELGESDSEYKVLITNTQILFKVGSNVPTHINADGLVSENVTVEEELRLTNKNAPGYYYWQTDQNGCVGLYWKGVD